MIALSAGSITGFLNTRPAWLKARRWRMGTVLAGFALQMAFERL
jgi:threonine/homoserine/homoserine lactone efflux protein